MLLELSWLKEQQRNDRDLGIIITENLKPASQCVKAAAKARSVLGVVRRHFKRLDPQDFLIIYKSYIRPHLEYCIQAWSPYLQKDIYCLESVQHATTRLVRGFRNVPYEDRLRILGLSASACWTAPCSNRLISPATRALSSKPAASRHCWRSMGQTGGCTDCRHTKARASTVT